MPKHRDLDPLDSFPADWTDALQEFVSGLAAFAVRVKATDATVLQVAAGAGNDQVAIPIEGRWRYITATVERAGFGANRSVDVWVTASDNSFAAGSPGEVDSTDYSFALAIAETGVPPTGVAIKRKVAVAGWDGSRFVAVDPVIGGAVDSGQRWRPGDLKFSARKTPELGWLLANNAPVTVANPALRTALIADGSPWGTDGSGNPRLPPMSGRVPMGVGTPAGAAGATNHVVGDVIGEERHTQTEAELVAHVHGIPYGVDVEGGGAFTLKYSSTQPPVGTTVNPTRETGGGQPFNVLQPSVVGSWFIKT